jgi:MSHA pilin protein MshC
LTIATTAGSTSCPGNALVGPKGESPATITARSGVTYQPTPTGFYFDGLGQPSAAQSIDVANAGASIALPIKVEAVTGYVHD